MQIGLQTVTYRKVHAGTRKHDEDNPIVKGSNGKSGKQATTDKSQATRVMTH